MVNMLGLSMVDLGFKHQSGHWYLFLLHIKEQEQVGLTIGDICVARHVYLSTCFREVALKNPTKHVGLKQSRHHLIKMQLVLDMI